MKRGWSAVLVCGVVAVEAALVIALPGCNGRVTNEPASSGSPSQVGGGRGDGGARGSTATGPYRITCSIHHRDLGAGVTEHTRTPLVFMSDDAAEKSVELPGVGIPVRAKLTPVMEEQGELIDLTIAFPRSNLEQHFVLEKDRMPPYELIGGHGFTGLNYVSTPGTSVDVQFICEASPPDEERPKPPPGAGGDTSPEPEDLPHATPFRIRCETIVGEGPGAQRDGFVLEGATERTLTVGGRRVELHLYDERFEGRSFVVRIPGVLQQLYQLDRTRPLANTTQGPGGLTGRTIVRPSAADAGGANAATDGGAVDTISLACGAARD